MYPIQLPLHVFLQLYTKANIVDIGINYMEGTKRLVEWLAPIKLPVNESPLIPEQLCTWETAEMARLLNVDYRTIISCILYNSKVITWTPEY